MRVGRDFPCQLVDETDLEPVAGTADGPDGLDHDVRDNGWNEAFSDQYKHCILQILHKNITYKY